jgi:hypothetical protein
MTANPHRELILTYKLHICLHPLRNACSTYSFCMRYMDLTQYTWMNMLQPDENCPKEVSERRRKLEPGIVSL